VNWKPRVVQGGKVTSSIDEPRTAERSPPGPSPHELAPEDALIEAWASRASHLPQMSVAEEFELGQRLERFIGAPSAFSPDNSFQSRTTQPQPSARPHHRSPHPKPAPVAAKRPTVGSLVLQLGGLAVLGVLGLLWSLQAAAPAPRDAMDFPWSSPRSTLSTSSPNQDNVYRLAANDALALAILASAPSETGHPSPPPSPSMAPKPTGSSTRGTPSKAQTARPAPHKPKLRPTRQVQAPLPLPRRAREPRIAAAHPIAPGVAAGTPDEAESTQAMAKDWAIELQQLKRAETAWSQGDRQLALKLLNYRFHTLTGTAQALRASILCSGTHAERKRGHALALRLQKRKGHAALVSRLKSCIR
jgi:hypothetical protein